MTENLRAKPDIYKETGQGTNNQTTVNNDWTRFSEWIQCMCVVTFDLNLGQALEFVYPRELALSEKEISNICYMAFPDSNSGCMGDTKFHIRFRIAVDNSLNDVHKVYSIYNSKCLPILRADHSHYCGFVYFRQKRDVNIPRGYFQKSFIIVSRLPFFNLYYDLLTYLAPKFFEKGNEVLIEACHQINNKWPALKSGIHLYLPIFDTTYQVIVPTISSRKIIKLPECNDTLKINNESKTTKDYIVKEIASINELNLFHSLGFVIENLYTLWELVLTAEPIVIIGTSPADCSHMVQSLVSLITPLEYCTEARPYFTIHDSEFKEFTRECGKLPPPIILGVTNPFFVKLLKDWPHMLRLVDTQINMQQLSQKNMQNSNSMASIKKISISPIISASGSSSISSDGSTSGLYTKYKSFLKKDKSFIKKVLLGIKTKRPEHVQTALLRRHLLELTHSFMIPLERYIASLMPLQKDISPFKSTPNASDFKLDDFLSTLELSGPHLTSPLRGDWKGLYKRFYNSPNFRGWYESRHRELQLTLQDLQLQALSEANLEMWARDKQEVEIIDMILKLKQKLNLYSESSGIDTSSVRDQIRIKINRMKDLLPHDLRNFINI